MATTMVKVYCLAPFDRVVTWHPEVAFDVYIDDLQISARGREDLIVENIVAAAADLRVAVRGEIMADLAAFATMRALGGVGHLGVGLRH